MNSVMKNLIISLIFFAVTPSIVYPQTCPQPFTLRSESCPGGASTCISKGTSLTYQELDRDILNAIGLCNGPGQFTWPSPSAGTLISDSSGNITIGASGGGAPTTSQYVMLSNDATTSAERVLTPGLGLSGTDAGANSTYTLAFKTSDTLAANPALSSEQVVFTTDGSGGGLLFEGVTADTIEGILIWNPTTADRTLTLPDESGTLCSTGSVCTGYAAGSGGVATSATTATTATSLAANGTNCTAGQAPLGVDASGNVEGCFTPSGGGGAPTGATYILASGFDATLTNERVISAGAGIKYTDGGANSSFIISTDSTTANFLTSGALTCGASTAGKMMVNTTPIQYCDNSATPTLRYSAYGDNTGNALTGDSATSFFPSGTIEASRGGTGIDSSALTGICRTSSGVWTCDASIAHLASSTSANLATVLSNETGTGSVVFSADPALTGNPTAPTAAADDNDTSVSTTGFVQQEINGSGGRSITCTSGSCDADVELYEYTKCITIENPTSADDFLFFHVERASVVTGIDCLVVGGTSVATLVKECDTSGATCGNTEASITCGTTNTTESAGIDDSAWDAGDWIRVDPGTVTGSVTQLSVCVTYQVAD